MPFLPRLSLAAIALLSLSTTWAQQLADGTYIQYGSINTNLMWQASGQLSRGRCPVTVKISDCYIMQLGATGNLQSTAKPTTTRERRDLSQYDPSRAGQAWAGMSQAEQRAIANDDDLESYFEAFPDQAPANVNRLGKRQVATCSTDTPPPTSTTTITSGGSTTTVTVAPTSTPTPQPPSPRQRNEFLTWPGAPAGSTWKYTWKSYQSAGTSTTASFFHSWQILRRDACGGPVMTLDYQNGQVRLQDFVRGCYTCAQPLAPGVSYWFGKTISHTLTITYGISGSMSYAAYSDTNLRRALITYNAKGDMGSSASLKFGNYRALVKGVTAATAYVGDLVSTRIS